MGAELLALCQTITEDGRLTDLEVGELKQWLSTNRNSDLPAIDYLVEIVEEILADGRVSEDERKRLHLSLEKVLPPEYRQDALAARRQVVQEERDLRAAQKESDRLEKQRNRPISSADFMVAGVHIGDRPAVVEREAIPGCIAYLAREPNNQYSRNAIEIRLSSGRQIGYVPESDAVRIAPLLDAGGRVAASVKKVLTGGRVPIPVVVASVYSNDSDVPGAHSSEDVPTKPAKPLSQRRKAGSCCLTTAAIGAMVVAGGIWLLLLP